MLDNAPAWFKVKHLKNQLLIFIVDNRETLVNDLDVHLNKTKKSLQQICFDLLEDNDLNYTIDFIISALSLMLEIPILMVHPIQHKSKTNEIYYSYQEIFPTEEQKNNTSANSKICLIWNGIDTFVPFLNISIAEIYNLGVPAMRSVFDMFNSCKDLVKFVPSKSSLKGATMEIVGHLRAALKLAATVHFTDGSSGFSPEEPEGEELKPTGDPLKTVETRKRRKLPLAETETSATKKSKTQLRKTQMFPKLNMLLKLNNQHPQWVVLLLKRSVLIAIGTNFSATVGKNLKMTTDCRSIKIVITLMVAGCVVAWSQIKREIHLIAKKCVLMAQHFGIIFNESMKATFIFIVELGHVPMAQMNR